jgi:S-methylmethionine-dependent homocysteine/selenocysteine methylase
MPGRSEDFLLTDGGIETSLIFDAGLDLPHFAAFPLVEHAAGRSALEHYYEPYLDVAAHAGFGFVLESPTWRASPDWASRLGYSKAGLARANGHAIRLMHELRRRHEARTTPVLVSGCVGPRGDGYIAGEQMPVDAAQTYHAEQVAVLADAGCDLVSAITMTNVPEAVGVARAAMECGVPSVISFTVETDGRLPSGDTLEHAITAVDALTASAPVYYMINCAHPTHFDAVLDAGGPWVDRLGGLRANASCKSHQELNEAPDLDRGDPLALGEAYGSLTARLPGLRVLGGCCGTDHRHVAAIASAIRRRARS